VKLSVLRLSEDAKGGFCLNSVRPRPGIEVACSAVMSLSESHFVAPFDFRPMQKRGMINHRSGVFHTGQRAFQSVANKGRKRRNQTEDARKPIEG
jgi:hypothetical protein